MSFTYDNKAQIINLNIGTGIGTSVLQLVKVFEKVNNCKIPNEIESRRDGDLAYVVANNSNSIECLNWFPKRSLNEMCKDAWEGVKDHGLN